MVANRSATLWDEIWALLTAGRSGEAAAAALGALNESEDDPELRYLLGIALLDCGEVVAAEAELRRAVEGTEEWAEGHSALGWALFRAGKFAECGEQLVAALEADPELADAHQLRGLLAERAGDDSLAVVAFAQARRLDPEVFPEPYEMSEEEFLQVAEEVVAGLDPEVLKVMENTSLFVQPIPPDDLLTLDAPPLDPQILGLFQGTSLVDQSVSDTGTLPNTIHLFQNNLERFATDRETLENEIRTTVLHEIGHHLGWDEDDLKERGLD